MLVFRVKNLVKFGLLFLMLLFGSFVFAEDESLSFVKKQLGIKFNIEFSNDMKIISPKCLAMGFIPGAWVANQKIIYVSKDCQNVILQTAQGEFKLQAVISLEHKIEPQSTEFFLKLFNLNFYDAICINFHANGSIEVASFSSRSGCHHDWRIARNFQDRAPKVLWSDLILTSVPLSFFANHTEPLISNNEIPFVINELEKVQINFTKMLALLTDKQGRKVLISFKFKVNPISLGNLVYYYHPQYQRILPYVVDEVLQDLSLVALRINSTYRNPYRDNEPLRISTSELFIAAGSFREFQVDKFVTIRGQTYLVKAINFQRSQILLESLQKVNDGVTDRYIYSLNDESLNQLNRMMDHSLKTYCQKILNQLIRKVIN